MLPLPSMSLRLSVLAGVGAAVGLLLAGPIAAAPPACVDEIPPNCADNSPAPIDPGDPGAPDDFGAPDDPGANAPAALAAGDLPANAPQAARDALDALVGRFEAIQARIAAMHELVAKVQAAHEAGGDVSAAAQDLRAAVHALLLDFSGALPDQAVLALLGGDDDS